MDYMNQLQSNHELNHELNHEPHHSNQEYEEYIFQSQKREEPRPMKTSKLKKVVGYTFLSAFIFGVVSGGIIWSMTYPLRKDFKKNLEQKQVVQQSEKIAQGIKSDNLKDVDVSSHTLVEEVVQKAMPSIVAITNQSVSEVRDIFGRGLRSYESSSAGSGIIIQERDEELMIATNFHVVDHANTLSVSFVDNEVVGAQIRGVDPETDLAIVSVKKADVAEATLNKIKVADIYTGSEHSIGAQVVAIGNALGYGQSVTTGIISAIRHIDFSGNGVENKWIQTDAAINPGNSGGALLDAEGKVIGINTIKLSKQAVEGMGYAISMEEAMPILEALMNGTQLEEYTSSGFLGITGVAVSDAAKQTYDIPKGVYIIEVVEGSPADSIGLKKGDVIQSIEGEVVSEPKDLKKVLSKYRPNDQVEIQLQSLTDQGYELINKTVELGQRPEQ